jgi:hypothetical protein
MNIFGEGLFTLAFGGGTTAIVAYVYWKSLRTLTQSHKDTVDAIVAAHKSEMESICVSFDKANEQRTKDIQLMIETFSPNKE